MFDSTYKNKTVLITGPAGFKGSWLAIRLKELGQPPARFHWRVTTKKSTAWHFKKSLEPQPSDQEAQRLFSFVTG